MNLILTSDFPSSPNDAVLKRILAAGESRRVAWVPPLTSLGKEKFPAAQAQFRTLGIETLEFCDIDQNSNQSQLLNLDQYAVIYFTGGDPLVFRKNIERSGISAGIRRCLSAGRLIVAASGGAMQFARNVSLYRLLSEPVEAVIANNGQYSALGLVDYELLPHVNRLDSGFLDNVRRYSEGVPSEIVALEDGAAMIHSEDGRVTCAGRGMKFRRGESTEIGE